MNLIFLLLFINFIYASDNPEDAKPNEIKSDTEDYVVIDGKETNRSEIESEEDSDSETSSNEEVDRDINQSETDEEFDKFMSAKSPINSVKNDENIQEKTSSLKEFLSWIFCCYCKRK